jgi:hypothetical protein
LSGLTPGPYAVEEIHEGIQEAEFGSWLVLAPSDPDVRMDDDNAMTVAIVTTTRETADLFAGSGELVEAAKELLDHFGQCTREQWEALRRAVECCKGRQP